MKMILMAGAAVLATTAAAMPAFAADTADAATVAVPNNPLLAKWTGPYDGVPPWDQVKPELFDEAIQFGIDETKREYAAIANNPAAPTVVLTTNRCVVVQARLIFPWRTSFTSTKGAPRFWPKLRTLSRTPSGRFSR